MDLPPSPPVAAGPALDSSSSQPPAPTPVAPRDRVALLDALRGFALIGILIANLATFSFYSFMGPAQRAAMPLAGVDFWAERVIFWLVDGKFYSVFSLLFGIGFSIQMGRAEAHGDRLLRTFKRRLLVLLGIGAVHLAFWVGDIVAFYALVGFLLIRLRHLSDRRLLGWAAAMIAMVPVLYALLYLSGGKASLGLPFYLGGFPLVQRLGVRPDQLYSWLRNATFLESFRNNGIGVFFRYADLMESGRVLKVLAMFLLGLYVGRHGLFRDPAAHAPMLRRLARYGLLIGLPAGAAMSYFQHAMVSGGGFAHPATLGYGFFYALGVPTLALGYAATFALLWTHPAGHRMLSLLAPAGRMALTHYLMHTAIGLMLFPAFALGLGGRVGPSLFIPIALAVVAFQALLSRWWLTRYRFGPAEWLWRSLTYGRAQPMRRSSSPVPITLEPI